MACDTLAIHEQGWEITVYTWADTDALAWDEELQANVPDPRFVTRHVYNVLQEPGLTSQALDYGDFLRLAREAADRDAQQHALAAWALVERSGHQPTGHPDAPLVRLLPAGYRTPAAPAAL